MTKISNTLREQMVAALVKHRFKAEATALTTRNRLLFERVYNIMYDAKTRAAMDDLLALHTEAFAETDELYVNVGMSIRLKSVLYVFVRGVGVLAEGAKPTREFHVLHRDNKWDCRVDIPADDKRDPKLNEDIRNFATDLTKFETAYGNAASEATAALRSFTTAKRLAEGWPEAMEVIGHLIPEDNRTLPAVQVKELNAKFGLPPETKVKA